MNYFKKVIFGILALVVLASVFALPVKAQGGVPAQQFFRGKVLEVINEEDLGGPGFAQPVQTLRVQVVNGPQSGEEVQIDHGTLFPISERQKVKVGDEVVMTTTQDATGEILVITDKYRVKSITLLAVVTGVAVLALLGWHAFRVIGVFGLGSYLLAQLSLPFFATSSLDPTAIGLVGVLIFLGVYVGVTEGFGKESLVSYLSSSSVVAIMALSVIFLGSYLSLTGFGTQEALLLQGGVLGSEKIIGVYITGIMLATVGLVVDLTTYQVVVVQEYLKKEHTILGLAVAILRDSRGKMVYTLSVALFLVVGISLPLLFFVTSTNTGVPFWVSFNSELIMKELVRIFALIFAVMLTPLLTSLFASTYLTPQKSSRKRK